MVTFISVSLCETFQYLFVLYSHAISFVSFNEVLLFLCLTLLIFYLFLKNINRIHKYSNYSSVIRYVCSLIYLIAPLIVRFGNQFASYKFSRLKSVCLALSLNIVIKFSPLHVYAVSDKGIFVILQLFSQASDCALEVLLTLFTNKIIFKVVKHTEVFPTWNQ